MGLMIVGAILIGITLGLLGSGGSILTVPVLVYVLGHQDRIAICESMAIVGSVALIGATIYAKQIDWNSILYFGLPGILGAQIGAWLANFISGPLQMILFAIVMLAAAIMMYRNSRGIRPTSDEKTPRAQHPVWLMILEGIGVAMITGLVGVGGGFLIVPALVLLVGLSMRIAVGTSLIVIAINSFGGFLKRHHDLSVSQLFVDWKTIGIFVAFGVIGTWIGGAMNKRIDQQSLKRYFSIFLVAMGLFVLWKEFPKLSNQTAPSTSPSTLNRSSE